MEDFGGQSTPAENLQPGKTAFTADGRHFRFIEHAGKSVALIWSGEWEMTKKRKRVFNGDDSGASFPNNNWKSEKCDETVDRLTFPLSLSL